MQKFFDMVRGWSSEKTFIFWCVAYTLFTLVASCLPTLVMGSNITAYNTQAFLLAIIIPFTAVYVVKDISQWVRIKKDEKRWAGARASSGPFIMINLIVSGFAWTLALFLGLIVTQKLDFFWFLFVLQVVGLAIGAPLMIYRMAQFYHMKYTKLLLAHTVQAVVIFAGVFTLFIKTF